MNYTILPKSLVVNYDGKTFTISQDDHRYKLVINAIKDKDFNKAKSIVENNTIFTGDLELKDGQLYYKSEKLPRSLSERVLSFAKNDLPFDYLIKFFDKLRANPSYNSRDMLYKFLEHNGHPITPEGNFIAYRGVTGDFKDMHTGKFDNSVGSVCEMPREQVDDNPNNTCSAGLHVACYEYAKNFGHILVEVEVDPRDVVCVPIDYNGTKIRCCKFKVINTCEKEHTNIDLYDTKKCLNYGERLLNRAVKLFTDYGERYGIITNYCEYDGYYFTGDGDGMYNDWYSIDDFEVL